MFAFITPQNIFKRWQDSKTYTDQLTNPFPEFQRIARNEPYSDKNDNYPNVTDGTTASIIQKTPKRVVQQLPTGSIEGEDTPEWLRVVAEFILSEKIIPYANEEYSLFEKSQLVIESGLTYGFGLSYSPFVNHDGYYCPDMTLPYWGDVYLQRGKKSGKACSYIFIRSWWQSEDIDALIKSEQEAAAQAKQNGGTYESTWDTAALQEVKDKLSAKDSQSLTPTEEERGSNVTAVEFVTVFQKGVGAKFYTFNPASKTIVRTKTNKDPRGKMPLDWFYGDIDGTNPFGRGIVELLGGIQNLIDSDMQAYQYRNALDLQPPVLKIGDVGNFSFEPNFVAETTDTNAKLVPLTISTAALTNYPQLYQLQQSQLFNLVSAPTNGTLSSSDVALGQGKTPTALNQQKANLSVDDNTIRKQFETWFAAWCETAINLYFAERSGKEMLQLDESTAYRLKRLVEEGELDPSFINEQDQIMIDYDTDTPVLKFHVDASTSKMADDQSQLQALELIQKFIDSSPTIQSLVNQFPEKLIALYNGVISLAGVEDPEEYSIDQDEFKKLQEQQQAMAQAQAQRPPSESMNFKDVAATDPQASASMLQQAGLPADGMMQQQAPQQPQMEEPPLVTHLRQLGLSDQAIQQTVMQVMNQQGGVVNG